MSRAQRKRLEKLRLELPTVDCKGLCHRDCNPVHMSDEERRQIEEYTGQPLKKATDMDNQRTLICPYLTRANRCGIYEVRPLICRIAGVTESLRCTYGCKPTRLMSHQEAGVALHSVGTDVKITTL